MKSIGIRELRQHASTYLRLVKAGESVEITERGEPIAMLTPIQRQESALERLRRRGLLIPAEEPGDLLDLMPLPPRRGVPLPSELLEQDRAESR